MKLTIRAATVPERLYTQKQSMQIAGQSGYTGCLQIDPDADGQGFVQTWQGWASRETEEFQEEFESVQDTLTDGFLKSPDSMAAYCAAHPEGRMGDSREYAFRADMAQYSYLLRCSPAGEDNHVRIYCYQREWLARQIKQAERGIRFITPDYKEKFRIPDGDMVRIERFDGSAIDRVCRYIDDYHLEVGNELFHICQFAEIMERNGNSVIPLRSALPEKCVSIAEATGEIIIITKGETGCRCASIKPEGVTSREGVDAINAAMGVTKAQEAAMLAGSMFGWHTPAADPKNYDEQGRPIKPRQRDRGDAR